MGGPQWRVSMSKDQTVTTALLGTRRLQLRWEKPGTEAGHPGGDRAAVLLSGHGRASNGTRTEGGAAFQPGFVLWTHSRSWLSVPLDQNLLTLTSPVLCDLFLISLQLCFY